MFFRRLEGMYTVRFTILYNLESKQKIFCSDKSSRSVSISHQARPYRSRGLTSLRNGSNSSLLHKKMHVICQCIKTGKMDGAKINDNTKQK